MKMSKPSEPQCCDEKRKAKYTEFGSKEDVAGVNVSAAAHSGSQITAPVITNNTITGDVIIIHNTPDSFSSCRPSETTQTSAALISKHKNWIKDKYLYVTEYNSLPGEHVLLSERYAQPLILQGHRGQEERREEISSSGKRLRRDLSKDSVHLNSLFDPDGRGIRPSAVILQGNSGNGKSFTVQKIMLDWASGDLYKERFDVVLHLKCKEINRISCKKSLLEILSCSCILSPDQIKQVLQHSPEKILFIIDGFDELRLTQDINDMTHTDLLQKDSPEFILCDLLRGRILPESHLLVTSRSTAADALSKRLKQPQRFSEIVGFSEKGVEEYFQKFFPNEEDFRKTYTLVKENETLITACSIPVVCWIICTTIKERLKTGDDLAHGLETTTSIYVDFVITLLKHHCQGSSQSIPTLLRSLGQLAERGVLEQQVLLDEKTVKETVSDPAGTPFLSKFLFKRRIHQETMFSFMHLSFQEFFTALYYVLLDEEEFQRKLTQLFPTDENSRNDQTLSRFSAVVQFAFGLLNKDVRETLEKHDLSVSSETQIHLKEWILKMAQKEDIYSDNSRMYLHCLYELHEDDFVERAMEAWKMFIQSSIVIYSRTDFRVLLYCAQFCQSLEDLHVVMMCSISSEMFRMILPVCQKCKEVNGLTVEVSSDSEVEELLNTFTRAQTSCVDVRFTFTEWKNCSVWWSCSEEISVMIETSLCELCLTFQCPDPINIGWTELIQIIRQQDPDALMSVLHSFSKLKKIEMKLDCLSEMWTDWTLKIIQKCSSLTELNLIVKASSDSEVEELMNAFTRAQTPRSLSVDVNFRFTEFEDCSLHYSDNEEISIMISTSASLRFLKLTFQCPDPINIGWTELIQIIQQDPDALMSVLHSFSKLKEMKMKLDCLSEMWTDWTLQVIQNCSSLTELRVDADFLLEEGIQILQTSPIRAACSVTFQGLMCNNQFVKCRRFKDRRLSCNQMLKIHLSSSGSSMETLNNALPLFLD